MEVHTDPDRITLWGPQVDDDVTVAVFKKMTESLEHDLLTSDAKQAVTSHKLNPN